MREIYIQDKTYDKSDFSQNNLIKGEYENCTFNNCDFSNKDFSNFKFIDCKFIGCNLSLAKLHNTAFQDIKFKDCKMLGLRFDTCNVFRLSFLFDHCILSHSSFCQTKIKQIIFKNSHLNEVDFSDCDLTGSVFDTCDLLNAVFDNAIIEKADFRTAYNHSIDPERNRITKAKFSFSGIAGLLDKYDIIIE